MAETKKCARCKEVLPVTDFHVQRSRGEVGYQAYCKPCHREKKREGRQASPDVHRASQKVWRDKNRDKVNAKKREYYRRDFAENPEKFLKQGRDYRTAHSDELRQYWNTYRRERVANNKHFLNEFKEATPCTDCGNKYPAVCMDFDHVPERGKKFKDISKIAHWGLDRLMDEIAKCDLVCSNCHRVRTVGRILRKSAKKNEAA